MRERPLPPVYRPAAWRRAGIITAHSLDPHLIAPRVRHVDDAQRRRPAVVARARAGQRDHVAPQPVFVLNGLSRRVSACRARGDDAARRGGDRRSARDRTATAPTCAHAHARRADDRRSPKRRGRCRATHLSARTRRRPRPTRTSCTWSRSSSYFGHLNRIADATRRRRSTTSVQARRRRRSIHRPRRGRVAPKPVAGRPAIELARRPATANALAEWRNYVFYRDAPLTRRQRTLIARWVATWLGDGGISPPTDLTVNPLDDALRAFAEVVTLAPWQISDDDVRAAARRRASTTRRSSTCARPRRRPACSRAIEVALVALGDVSPKTTTTRAKRASHGAKRSLRCRSQPEPAQAPEPEQARSSAGAGVAAGFRQASRRAGADADADAAAQRFFSLDGRRCRRSRGRSRSLPRRAAAGQPRAGFGAIVGFAGGGGARRSDRRRRT